MGANGFTIRHPRQSNLTLATVDGCMEVVNVVASQLENLTIRNCSAKHVISAPHLISFLYKGGYPLRLSTDGFHSLEKADLCISSPNNANTHELVFLLQQLRSVKFLSLNSEIVKVCCYWSFDVYHVHLSKIFNPNK